MTAPKLSPETQYRIYVRANKGENYLDLAAEYGVSKILIGRIAHRDPKKMAEEAGLVGEFKPRHKVPAVTTPLTVPPKQEQATVATMDTLRGALRGSEIMSNAFKPPTQDINLLCPPGRRMEPVGLVRKYGTHSQVTGHGSVVVVDSEGKAVRVLRCPVYDEKWRTIRVEDVEITSINGVDVRGEIRKWSGGTVTGSLVINGIKSPDSGQNIITRVEFHPDSLPAKYVKETEALRRKLL